MAAKLRYEGKYDWLTGDSRTWTIMNRFVTGKGEEIKGSSFMLDGLIRLGIVPYRDTVMVHLIQKKEAI